MEWRKNTTHINFKLLDAAKGGNVFEVKKLIKQGGEVNFAEPRDRQTALHLSSYFGHLDIVIELITNGAEIQAKTNSGRTPLIVACIRGYLLMLKLLLDNGSNVQEIDNDKWTGLHWACTTGHLAVVKHLIAHGAEIQAKTNNGKTPLLCACTNGHLPVVECLMDHGSNVQEIDINKQTGLHCACGNGHLDVVKFLSKKGAAINSTNGFGKRPLDLARMYKKEAVVSFLENLSNVEKKNGNMCMQRSIVSEDMESNSDHFNVNNNNNEDTADGAEQQSCAKSNKQIWDENNETERNEAAEKGHMIHSNNIYATDDDIGSLMSGCSMYGSLGGSQLSLDRSSKGSSSRWSLSAISVTSSMKAFQQQDGSLSEYSISSSSLDISHVSIETKPLQDQCFSCQNLKKLLIQKEHIVTNLQEENESLRQKLENERQMYNRKDNGSHEEEEVHKLDEKSTLQDISELDEMNTVIIAEKDQARKMSHDEITDTFETQSDEVGNGELNISQEQFPRDILVQNEGPMSNTDATICGASQENQSYNDEFDESQTLPIGFSLSPFISDGADQRTFNLKDIQDESEVVQSQVSAKEPPSAESKASCSVISAETASLGTDLVHSSPHLALNESEMYLGDLSTDYSSTKEMDNVMLPNQTSMTFKLPSETNNAPLTSRLTPEFHKFASSKCINSAVFTGSQQSSNGTYHNVDKTFSTTLKFSEIVLQQQPNSNTAPEFPMLVQQQPNITAAPDFPVLLQQSNMAQNQLSQDFSSEQLQHNPAIVSPSHMIENSQVGTTQENPGIVAKNDIIQKAFSLCISPRSTQQNQTKLTSQNLGYNQHTLDISPTRPHQHSTVLAGNDLVQSPITVESLSAIVQQNGDTMASYNQTVPRGPETASIHNILDSETINRFTDEATSDTKLALKLVRKLFKNELATHTAVGDRNWPGLDKDKYNAVTDYVKTIYPETKKSALNVAVNLACRDARRPKRKANTAQSGPPEQKKQKSQNEPSPEGN